MGTQKLLVCCVVVAVAQPALAGGLFIPGSGAITTSRAGAAVASVDDSEALSVNPAGLARAKGLKITVSLALVRYFMSFTRRGTYDPISLEDRAYEGQPYDTVENKPKPPLGIGTYQPLPVIGVSWDTGGRVKNLTLGAGLYTPMGYPFRDMSTGYQFNNQSDDIAPPPTRYDIMKQESALLLPSIAAAYRINENFDVGLRFTAGNLKSKTEVIVWGGPNVQEDIKNDTLFSAEVADGFIPAFGIGASYRIGPSIELGANFSSPLSVNAKGTAKSVKGPSVDMSRQIGPVPDDMAACAKGGTMEEQKACISLQLPMHATVGGRYKFVDEIGRVKGDVELDVNWENWGKTCDYHDEATILASDCTSPGQYRVQIDSGLYVNGNFQQKLNVNAVNLGLRDTFGVRLGGSYNVPVGANSLVLRGGVAYDTQAAKTGWLRANFDGAARMTGALGGSYKAESWEVSAGLGYVHEGTNTNPGAAPDGTDCNPTEARLGCVGDGSMRPPEQRQGPDPTSPLLTPDTQFENPYNQGSIKSHYLMFMFGFSKSF